VATITADIFSRQQFVVCTAEAVSAKVFKLPHYAGFSSIRTLEAVSMLFLLTALKLKCPLKYSKSKSVIYNSCEMLTFFLLFQFRITSLWAVNYLL